MRSLKSAGIKPLQIIKMSVKYLVLSVLLVLSVGSYSQKDTTAVLESISKLEEALVKKQKNEVENLLHAEVVYGHSNGWVQNKDEVLRDMESGYLIYKVINRESVSIEIKKRKAFVREIMNVEGSRNGTEFKMKLFVLQLWVQMKKDWVMLMRQSTKI